MNEDPKATFLASKEFEPPININRKIDVIKTELITRSIYLEYWKPPQGSKDGGTKC